MLLRTGVAAFFAVLLAAPVAAVADSSPPTCHNSFDPSCGPFYWTPDPGPNAPATASVTYSPAHPKPGDTMTFTATIDDPDSGSSDLVNISKSDFGDGPAQYVVCDPPSAFGYGPWDTPPKKPLHTTVTLHHKYKHAGDYPAAFTFDLCGSGPYRNSVDAGVTVKVRNLPLGLFVCSPNPRVRIMQGKCY